MANKRALDEVAEKKMLELHQEGYSGTVIAEKLGVKPKTLYPYLHKHGIRNARGGKRTFIEERVLTRVKELYARGLSVRAVAEQVDLPWGVVHARLKEEGVELRAAGFQEGDGHHAWRGGRIQTEQGYVLVRVGPEDPFYSMGQSRTNSPGKYVLEHRLVMARKLRRVLLDHETVHHVDGDRANNDPSNLQLRQGKHGKGAAHRCGDCGSTNIIPLALS